MGGEIIESSWIGGRPSRDRGDWLFSARAGVTSVDGQGKGPGTPLALAMKPAFSFSRRMRARHAIELMRGRRTPALRLDGHGSHARLPAGRSWRPPAARWRVGSAGDVRALSVAGRGLVPPRPEPM